MLGRRLATKAAYTASATSDGSYASPIAHTRPWRQSKGPALPEEGGGWVEGVSQREKIMNTAIPEWHHHETRLCMNGRDFGATQIGVLQLEVSGLWIEDEMSVCRACLYSEIANFMVIACLATSPSKK